MMTDARRSERSGTVQEEQVPSRAATSVAALQAERDELFDRLQRLAAEFDNFRKRNARENAALTERANERLVKELIPILDDLGRALEAAAEHEEAKLEEGVRLVHRSLAELLDEGRPRRDRHRGQVRPARARGAALAAVRRGGRLRDRSGAEGLQARRQGAAPGARRRRGSADPRGVSADALRHPRGEEGRVGGRGQEGLPQARRQVPPGQEPGRRFGRGEVQGSAERVRRSVGHREAEAVRPFRRRERPVRLRCGRLQLPQRQLRRRRSRRPVRRTVQSRHDAHAPAAARARRRHRGAGQPFVRGLAARARDEDPGRGHDCLPRVRRHRCGARHDAGHLSRVQRPRRHLREPGPVRALAAVSALPRQRHRRSRSRATSATAPGRNGARAATRCGSRPASRTARASG